MDVYRRPSIAVDAKADHSPVTAADHASERLILEGLRARISGHSLRGRRGDRGRRCAGRARRCFFLVDPLDGTQANSSTAARTSPSTSRWSATACRRSASSMRRRSGEMYSGRPGQAEAIELGHGYARREPPHGSSVRSGADAAHDRRQPLAPHATRPTATSRKFEAAEIVSVGSSLKFCMIACGEADLYPRFGRTMEWDTAAGDAVLRPAGGTTRTLDGRPLTYGKRDPGGHEADFANPHLHRQGPRRLLIASTIDLDHRAVLIPRRPSTLRVSITSGAQSQSRGSRPRRDRWRSAPHRNS